MSSISQSNITSNPSNIQSGKAKIEQKSQTASDLETAKAVEALNTDFKPDWLHILSRP